MRTILHLIQQIFMNNKNLKLLVSIFLNLLITIFQIIGGLLSGSVALLSDAAHNFVDTLSLTISFVAIKFSAKNKTLEHTFGYKRAEILAAFFNATLLLIMSFFLIKEAIIHFFMPAKINSVIMIVVATFGFLANTFSALLLRHDSAGNMNLRSAYLHLFSDAATSLAVIVGGVCIFLWEITWIDSLISILIVIFILKEGYKLLKESVNILMQNTPAGLDLKIIQQEILKIDGINHIHHLHVWQVDENDVHLEAHINSTKDVSISESCKLREAIEGLLLTKFHINHVTLQLEYGICKDTSLIKQ